MDKFFFKVKCRKEQYHYAKQILREKDESTTLSMNEPIKLFDESTA